MASVSTSKISCGVYQLYDLRDPSHMILKKLMGAYKGRAENERRRFGFAQVIWSDVDGSRTPYISGNGDRFWKYLQKNFPRAEIVSLRAESSPSTGNHIRTWIWTISHGAFVDHKFYKKAASFDPVRDPEGRAERREERNERITTRARERLLDQISEVADDIFAELHDELE